MKQNGNGWNGTEVAVVVGVTDRRRDAAFRDEVGAILDTLRAVHRCNIVRVRALQREIDAERERASETRAALVRSETLQRMTLTGGANDA